MSWSTAGGVATDPSYTPATYSSSWSAGSPPLTFRVDVNAGIVYVTGSVLCGTGATSNNSTIGTVPDAVRPRTAQTFLSFYRQATGGPVANAITVSPLGTLASGVTSGGASYAVNGIYFLDI